MFPWHLREIKIDHVCRRLTNIRGPFIRQNIYREEQVPTFLTLCMTMVEEWKKVNELPLSEITSRLSKNIPASIPDRMKIREIGRRTSDVTLQMTREQVLLNIEFGGNTIWLRMEWTSSFPRWSQSISIQQTPDVLHSKTRLIWKVFSKETTHCPSIWPTKVPKN